MTQSLLYKKSLDWELIQESSIYRYQAERFIQQTNRIEQTALTYLLTDNETSTAKPRNIRTVMQRSLNHCAPATKNTPTPLQRLQTSQLTTSSLPKNKSFQASPAYSSFCLSRVFSLYTRAHKKNTTPCFSFQPKCPSRACSSNWRISGADMHVLHI